MLASGGRDLSLAQRAMLSSTEIAAKSVGTHAEVTAINGARAAGLHPQAMGVSRRICPECRSFLENDGATIIDETKVWWPRAER